MDKSIKFRYIGHLSEIDLYSIQNFLTFYAKNCYSLVVKRPYIYIHINSLIYTDSGKSELDFIKQFIKFAASKKFNIAYEN